MTNYLLALLRCSSLSENMQIVQVSGLQERQLDRSPRLAEVTARASLCTQTLDNPLLDDRVSSLSLLMKQMLHPRCERVARRATTQGPIR